MAPWSSRSSPWGRSKPRKPAGLLSALHRNRVWAFVLTLDPPLVLLPPFSGENSSTCVWRFPQPPPSPLWRPCLASSCRQKLKLHPGPVNELTQVIESARSPVLPPAASNTTALCVPVPFPAQSRSPRSPVLPRCAQTRHDCAVCTSSFPSAMSAGASPTIFWTARGLQGQLYTGWTRDCLFGHLEW